MPGDCESIAGRKGSEGDPRLPLFLKSQESILKLQGKKIFRVLPAGLIEKRPEQLRKIVLVPEFECRVRCRRAAQHQVVLFGELALAEDDGGGDTCLFKR